MCLMNVKLVNTDQENHVKKYFIVAKIGSFECVYVIR